MAVWMVRTRDAEDEDAALEQGLALIGFSSVPSLSSARNLKEFQLFCQRALAGRPAATIARLSSQLWAFRGRIKQDDLILMPLAKRRRIALGKITGPYEFRAGLPGGSRHVRPVQWLLRGIQRSLLDEDILLSLSAAGSVAPIRRRNAEARLQAFAGQKPAEELGVAPAAAETEDTLDEDSGVHLEENARDQIRVRIARLYPGAGLATLVEALLQAQGYRTHVTSDNAEGAVGLMAGRGSMGFDPPRLCVLVSTTPVPAGANALKDLRTTAKNSGADQALLVSWRGFHPAAVEESKQRFFEVRLWDDEDLIDQIAASYEKLPGHVQAALPLRRIWTPLPEDDSL